MGSKHHASPVYERNFRNKWSDANAANIGSRFASPIKEAGAALISQVQTVAQAMEAVDMGSDIVVAQGTEAGGHARRARLWRSCQRLSTLCASAMTRSWWWQPAG